MAASQQTEEDNYIKLFKLVTGVGTDALRESFDRCFPPSTLVADLKKNELKLKKLNSERRLTAQQMSILFPVAGSPTSRDFDVTLMICLIRNLASVFPPYNGFDKLPMQSEISVGADIARIKYHRNMLAHADTNRISEPDFQSYWKDSTDAIVRLGGQHYQAFCDEIKELTLVGRYELTTLSQQIEAFRSLFLTEITELKGKVDILEMTTVKIIPKHIQEIEELQGKVDSVEKTSGEIIPKYIQVKYFSEANMNTEPSCDLLEKVAIAVGREGGQLGLILGLTDTVVDKYLHEKGIDMFQKNLRILEYWKSKVATKPTVQHLINAMSKIGVHTAYLYSSDNDGLEGTSYQNPLRICGSITDFKVKRQRSNSICSVYTASVDVEKDWFYKLNILVDGCNLHLINDSRLQMKYIKLHHDLLQKEYLFSKSSSDESCTEFELMYQHMISSKTITVSDCVINNFELMCRLLLANSIPPLILKEAVMMAMKKQLPRIAKAVAWCLTKQFVQDCVPKSVWRYINDIWPGFHCLCNKKKGKGHSQICSEELVIIIEVLQKIDDIRINFVGVPVEQVCTSFEHTVAEHKQAYDDETKTNEDGRKRSIFEEVAENVAEQRQLPDEELQTMDTNETESRPLTIKGELATNIAEHKVIPGDETTTTGSNEAISKTPIIEGDVAEMYFKKHTKLTMIYILPCKPTLAQFCCPIKKIIPIGEDHFPLRVLKYETNVEEGYVRFITKLRIGDEISVPSAEGTLGGFVQMLGFNALLTCSHVVFDRKRLVAGNKRAMHLETTEVLHNGINCGYVLNWAFEYNNSKETSVDAAVVKLPKNITVDPNDIVRDASGNPKSVEFLGMNGPYLNDNYISHKTWSGVMKARSVGIKSGFYEGNITFEDYDADEEKFKDKAHGINLYFQDLNTHIKEIQDKTPKPPHMPYEAHFQLCVLPALADRLIWERHFFCFYHQLLLEDFSFKLGDSGSCIYVTEDRTTQRPGCQPNPTGCLAMAIASFYDKKDGKEKCIATPMKAILRTLGLI